MEAVVVVGVVFGLGCLRVMHACLASLFIHTYPHTSHFVYVTYLGSITRGALGKPSEASGRRRSSRSERRRR